MASSFKTYGELVKMAYEGSLQLPAFQRGWRWGPAKVRNLFDSLRQKYPIGAFLFLQGNNADLSARPFHGSSPEARNRTVEYLVLDGQQRITAGIQLFFPEARGNQFYVDLRVLAELIAQKGIDLSNEAQVERFASSIDHQDGYIITRKGGVDPRAQLLTKNLLCTAILADRRKFAAARDDYLEANPEQRRLFSAVIEPYFGGFGADPIPVIEIGTDTGLDSIARIFTTLNTTGQMLTPFELVVAKLYPHGIELDKEVRDFKEMREYYGRMDSTGEILLQTIAMMGGADPKKSNLPRTITGPLYQEFKFQAVGALERLGEFLTKQLGAGLDSSSAESLVPYDAVFAPMAVAYQEVVDGEVSTQRRAILENALAQWYVASALSQRYQEGVHNKQEKDLKDFRLLVAGETNELPLLNGITYRRMLTANPNGAIGRLIKSMLNINNPRDPATEHIVGYSASAISTEKHHIFPTRWCPTGLAGWSDSSNSNLALNLMLVEAKTNKQWVNFSPGDQIRDAINHGRSLDRLRSIYDDQQIPENAFEILRKEALTAQDYAEFLLLREAAIQSFIRQRFGLDVASAATAQTETEVDDDA